MKEFNHVPGSKILKKMGFYDDQEGIMRRYINERSFWEPHLQNTKSFIRKCIEESKPSKIAVLGSGWLLDVPIDFLIETGAEIFLYDIRHPKQIIKKYEKEKNIKFKVQDITGGAIASAYECFNNKKSPVFQNPDGINCEGFIPGEPVDYIVSVNILNQLDILILEYLRKFNNVDSQKIMTLRQRIQKAHLNVLNQGNACMVSDFEEMLFDSAGSSVKTNSLLFTEIPSGKNTEQWIWKFDNHMAFYPNRNTHFRVKAVQY